MPTLLLRHPPPLVIEARDSRLPITSINPAFDKLLRQSNQLQSKAMARTKGKVEKEGPRDDISWNWEQRRLVVYTKKDLVDPVIQQVSRKQDQIQSYDNDQVGGKVGLDRAILCCPLSDYVSSTSLSPVTAVDQSFCEAW